MSRYAHKTKSQRKIITRQEWADYMGVSKQTIFRDIAECISQGTIYDPTDIYAIFDFYTFLIQKRGIPARKKGEEGGKKQ